MSNSAILTEDKRSTSTVGLRPVLWPKMPVVLPWCANWASIQVAGTSGAVWTIAEPSTCLVTAPTIHVAAAWDVSLFASFVTTVEYANRFSVEELVGSKGMAVLNRVTGLIMAVSGERGWPLVKIEVAQLNDAEVEDWRYVLVTPVFSSSFEEADKHLRAIYEDVDSLAHALDTDGQDILRRKVFFDVRPTL